MTKTSLLASALTLAIGLLLAPQSAAADEFTGRTLCVDNSGQGSSCVSCRATYNNGLGSGAEVTANVSLGIVNGAPQGCPGGQSSAGGVAAVNFAARVVGSGPGPVPVHIGMSASVNAAPPLCVGVVDFDVAGYHGHTGKSVSIDKEISAQPGQTISGSASAYLNCGGCNVDDQGHYSNCQSEGEAIADPFFSIDPSFPNAGLYHVEYFDDVVIDWLPMAARVLDHDNDGVPMPDDCDDWNAAINTNAVEIPGNGIDEDCNGGDGNLNGAVNGVVCTVDLDCESGTCVEGICCTTRCGNGDPADCQSCFQSATGLPDGTCGPLAAGTTCRGAVNLCDLPEACDGQHLTCPVDSWRQVGATCRPSTNACDPAETCLPDYPLSGEFTTRCPVDVVLGPPQCVVPSVASDATNYATGALVTITWAGLPGNAKDWVTLELPQSPYTAYTQWIYTGGAASGTAQFVAQQGNWVARAFSDDSFNLVAESTSFSVTGAGVATVATDLSSYNPPLAITATYAGLSSKPLDWVTIVAQGAPFPTHGEWFYTGGQTQGVAKFAQPPSGVYVVRAFYNDGYTLLAESPAFVVTSTPSVVTTDASSYSTSSAAPVIASYDFLPGKPLDWLNVVPVNAPLGSLGQWVYTGGAAKGSAAFSLPGTGTFVIRAFYDDGYALVAESAPFDVTGPPASVTPLASSFLAAETIGFDYMGSSQARDWICLAIAGSPDAAYIDWTYASGQPSGQMSFAPAAPGSYVLRLFANDSFAKLAESAVFTVQ